MGGRTKALPRSVGGSYTPQEVTPHFPGYFCSWVTLWRPGFGLSCHEG